MTTPVRSPNTQLRDGRFPLVAFVKHGANMRDFAPQIQKGLVMKINPGTKAAACKALGAFAERSVAMADAIGKGEDDPAAPALLPEEMALSVTTMGTDFAKEMGALLPQAAAAEPAAPAAPVAPVAPVAPADVEMTAEMVTSAESGIAKQDELVSVIEKGLKKALNSKNVVKVAKGLDDVAAFRKAMGDFPIAKAAAKKLTFGQYMKMQGTLLERFMQLVMEFLPLLAQADEEGPASAMEPVAAEPAAPAGPSAEEMSKSITSAVEMAVAKSMAGMDAAITARLAPMGDQLIAIAKSREGSNGLPPEARPSPADGNTDVIPFTSLTDSMRQRGLLPNKAQ